MPPGDLLAPLLAPLARARLHGSASKGATEQARFDPVSSATTERKVIDTDFRKRH